MLRSFANSLPSNREKFQGQKVEKQLAKKYLLRRWELIRDKNLPVLVALFFVVTLLPGGLGGLSHSCCASAERKTRNCQPNASRFKGNNKAFQKAVGFAQFVK